MRSASTSSIPQPQRQNSPSEPVSLAPKETMTEVHQPVIPSPLGTPMQISPDKPAPYPMSALNFAKPFNTSPSGSFNGMDPFMCLDEDNMLNSECNYQDLIMWNQYPTDLDMYPNIGLDNMAPPFLESAESYSSSEPTASGSMHTSISHPHTSSTSIDSTDIDRPFQNFDSEARQEPAVIPEFEVVIAAECAWPLARCNPPIFSGACPRTAILHLENLEQHSRYESTWRNMDQNIDSSDQDCQGEIAVIPLGHSTRDRILAITQSFLHTALETHRGGMKAWDKAASPGGNFNFLVLPPSKVLEYFLRSYVRSLSPYYTLINGGVLDPNELMLNNQASTLLLLLMIASGATAVPTAEARCLTAGLTETCRISLFHIIEKDVELSADPVVLRCALLFTILGAWSGDAWHMNIAMGQRGMYLAVSSDHPLNAAETDSRQMLKHAGMLEPSPPVSISTDAASIELRWRAWQEQESKSRYVLCHTLQPHLLLASTSP